MPEIKPDKITAAFDAWAKELKPEIDAVVDVVSALKVPEVRELLLIAQRQKFERDHAGKLATLAKILEDHDADAVALILSRADTQYQKRGR